MAYTLMAANGRAGYRAINFAAGGQRTVPPEPHLLPLFTIVGNLSKASHCLTGLYGQGFADVSWLGILLAML